MNVIGYGRVSTTRQADEGVSLEAQERIVRAEADRQGWQLDWLADKGVSGKGIDRPMMNVALALLAAGRADALIATKVDRISRSVSDFSALVERASGEGWRLIVLDVGMDTRSPYGEAMAQMVAVFAQLERRLISERTREGLAQKRLNGVRLGRPRLLPADVAQRIVTERMAGATHRAIADRLNAECVPTATGKTWGPGNVAMVLARECVQ